MARLRAVLAWGAAALAAGCEISPQRSWTNLGDEPSPAPVRSRDAGIPDAEPSDLCEGLRPRPVSEAWQNGFLQPSTPANVSPLPAVADGQGDFFLAISDGVHLTYGMAEAGNGWAS